MMKYLEYYLKHFVNTIVLKDFGWRKTFRMLDNEKVWQWIDPYSGHRYSEKTAMKLVRIQALDHLNKK